MAVSDRDLSYVEKMCTRVMLQHTEYNNNNTAGVQELMYSRCNPHPERLDKVWVRENLLGWFPEVFNLLSRAGGVVDLCGLDIQQHTHRLHYQLDSPRRILEALNLLYVCCFDGIECRNSLHIYHSEYGKTTKYVYKKKLKWCLYWSPSQTWKKYPQRIAWLSMFWLRYRETHHAVGMFTALRKCLKVSVFDYLPVIR